MDIPPEISSIIPVGLKQDERIFRHYTSDEDEPAVSGRNSTLISEHVQLNMVFFAFYYLYLAEKVVAMNDEKYAEYRKAIKNYRSDKKIYEIIPFFDSTLYNLHFLTREEAQEVLDGVDDTSDIKPVKPATVESDEQAETNDYIVEANNNFHPEADEIAVPNETLYWLHAQLDSMDPVRQQKRIKMASYLLERITWRRRRLAIMMFAKANPPNNENEEEQNAPAAAVPEHAAAGGAGAGKGGARRPKRHTKRQSTRRRKHRRTRKN